MERTVLRTGSGQKVPDYESEQLSSPAPVGQSAGIWRVVAAKCTRAPWTFPFKMDRTNSFRPGRTNKWKATSVKLLNIIKVLTVHNKTPIKFKMH